jgi:hypothetical protein
MSYWDKYPDVSKMCRSAIPPYVTEQVSLQSALAALLIERMRAAGRQPDMNSARLLMRMPPASLLGLLAQYSAISQLNPDEIWPDLVRVANQIESLSEIALCFHAQIALKSFQSPFSSRG